MVSLVLATLASAADDASDLDVAYIERTPRYHRYEVTYENDLPKLVPGTERRKRWPDPGEMVTYVAHVANKGKKNAGRFPFRWSVDGVTVLEGECGGLKSGEEVSFPLRRAWPRSNEIVEFTVDPKNRTPDSCRRNNSLAVDSHALTISIWIERGLYDLFHQEENPLGSRSFEDWIQHHFAEMNRRFSQAVYAVAPRGIRDRVRVDKVVIADELDGPRSPAKKDPDETLIDGRWLFTDGDPTNARGKGGAWKDYVGKMANTIEWAFIHELTHQLGVIDLYRFNPARLRLRDSEGHRLDPIRLPPVWGNDGLMGGGDTMPHRDGTYFDSHTAGGMNSHAGHRRGFYGEYLYDTPTRTSLLVLDAGGMALVGAKLALYQKNPDESLDDVPEISGVTDGKGILALPNREAPAVTTATGHTLRPNPFGLIHVDGRTGAMLIRITRGREEDFRWLTVTDLNLAYWSGHRDAATITIRSALGGKIQRPPRPVMLCPSGQVETDRSPIRMEWKRVSGADRYHVRVLDAAGETVFEHTANEPRVATVPLGEGAHTWLVSAHNGEGWGPASSGSIQISPRARSAMPKFVVPGEGEVVNSSKVRIEWSRQGDAREFRILILDTYGTILQDHSTTRTELTLTLGTGEHLCYIWGRNGNGWSPRAVRRFAVQNP